MFLPSDPRGENNYTLQRAACSENVQIWVCARWIIGDNAAFVAAVEDPTGREKGRVIGESRVLRGIAKTLSPNLHRR